MILLPLKLSTPISPKVPKCLFLKKLPTDSDESSIRNNLYFLDNFLNLLYHMHFQKHELELLL